MAALEKKGKEDMLKSYFGKILLLAVVTVVLQASCWATPPNGPEILNICSIHQEEQTFAGNSESGKDDAHQTPKEECRVHVCVRIENEGSSDYFCTPNTGVPTSGLF